MSRNKPNLRDGTLYIERCPKCHCNKGKYLTRRGTPTFCIECFHRNEYLINNHDEGYIDLIMWSDIFPSN